MSKEINEAIDDLGRTVEEFKSENDNRLAEIEKKGFADPLLSEKVDKMSTKIGELEEAKANLEKAVARKSAVRTEDDAKLEKKAANFSKLLSKSRGTKVEVSPEDLTNYKSALNTWMRRDERGMSADEQKALSVGIDPDGGYTVHPDMSGRMVSKVFESSPMRQVASVQTIGTDSLEGMYDLDEAASGWVAETGARTETSTPQLGKWSIPTHELYANPAATQKILDDSSINLEAWLSDKVSSKFARDEATAFVSGTGVGTPRGFLTYADGTTLPGTIEQFNTGASGAFAGSGAGGDVFFDLVYGMKAAYRNGARWALNRTTQAAVRKIKDSDGNYVWQAGLQAGTPSTLAGYPTLDFEDMPDIAANSLSIAFGNFAAGYQIVDRQGVRVLRDPYSNKPYIHFYTVKRVGGDVIDFDAIKLMKFAV